MRNRWRKGEGVEGESTDFLFFTSKLYADNSLEDPLVLVTTSRIQEEEKTPLPIVTQVSSHSLIQGYIYMYLSPTLLTHFSPPQTGNEIRMFYRKVFDTLCIFYIYKFLGTFYIASDETKTECTFRSGRKRSESGMGGGRGKGSM